jgi:small subunit ribosomal protein S14
MAKISMIVKAERKPKFSTRQRNRCKQCGRPRGFLRSLGGYVPGVTKSSW